MTEPLRVPRLASLRGVARVPGDKSISHRALIFAAVAEGESRIRNFLPSLDCLSTLTCLESLGVSLRRGPGTSVRVAGRGWAGLREPDGVLDAGNSGTTLRLLSGLLAGRPFHSVLTGDASLRRRPMGRITDPLRRMACEIRGRGEGAFAPLSIQGGNLRGIRYELPVASAQVKSCLILAALQARGRTTIVEPGPTRDHTERLLTRMGARLEKRGSTIRIEPTERLAPIDLEVPGDVSSAMFPIVAALLLPGSKLLLRDVGLNPTRTAALYALRRMGASISVQSRLRRAGEPLGKILVASSPLRGTTIQGAEVPNLIDEVPILAVAATQATGRTVIRDAGELRVKESDRIETLVRELRRLGARVEPLPDGMVIDGPTKLRGAPTNSHGDHRIGLALYVAGLVASGLTTIEEAGAMDVSFPGFDALLRRIGQSR